MMIAPTTPSRSSATIAKKPAAASSTAPEPSLPEVTSVAG